MTAQTIITAVDNLKPNQYSDADKQRWLRDLDMKIYNDIVLTHIGADPAPWYDDDGEVSTTYPALTDDLLVPEPYAYDLYVTHLQAQIDKENGEISKYNVSASLFSSAYSDYMAYYNRTHLPLSKGGYRF